MGTPAFMPPEQARGKLSQISPLTDVWAAGATMFTLLSGAQVHEGESSQEIMHNSATVPARSLAGVATDIPIELVRIVDRALAFAPADRWPSASAMRDAIAQAHLELFGVALVSEPTLPSNDVDVSISSPRSDRFSATVISRSPAASPRRTNTLVLGGVALALVLVLAIAGSVWAARSRIPAESRTPVVAGEPPPVAVVAATASPVVVDTAVVAPPSPTPSTKEVASIPTAKAAARPISNSPRPSPKPAARPNDWDHQ
jgi:serine/threonine-protein kinase